MALTGICGLLAIGLASLLGRPRTAQTPLLGLLTVLTLTAVAFFGNPNNACFRIDVTSVFGIDGQDFTGSPTKWVFSR